MAITYNNTESSTMYSYLCYDSVTGDTAKNAPTGSVTLTKVADIKDFPALGGAPEQVETTTLSNASSTFVTGVQSVDAFEFTANYTSTSFKKLKEIQKDNELRRFYIVFGRKEETSGTVTYGEYGVFYWAGTLSCWLDGGSVNVVRQTKISISSATEVQMVPDDVSNVTIDDEAA